MRSLKILVFIIIVLIFSCQRSGIKYPETKKVDQVNNYFGVEVKDPYRWLEDSENEDVKAWIQAQNKGTFNYLNDIPYRDKIKARITEILNYKRISTPVIKGGLYFYYKNDGLQNHDVLYYFKELNDEPKVALDPNTFSNDGSVALNLFEVSKGGNYLAYSISTSGSDWNEILIKDLLTGETLNDKIEGVKFSGIAWRKNGFYYSKYSLPDENNKYSELNLNHKVYYHKVGTDQLLDELVFEDKRFPNRNFYAYTTSDEKYLIISETESTNGNSIYINNLEKKDNVFTKLTTSFDYNYKVIDHINDNLYILTNYKAPKYKLIKINVNSLDVGDWKDVIPEKSEVIEFCEIVGNNIVAGYIKDAYSNLELYDLKGKYIKDIEIPKYGNVTAFNGKMNVASGFFSYSSFTTPTVIYQFNSNNDSITEYFKPELNFNPDLYETKQITYRSSDGTKIPMFIVYKKGIPLNGENPTLLYGYGGFNISILPQFKVSTMVWLENGGIYASANIRGGGEYGENWHLQGTKFNKQIVFNDFISAAKFLFSESYTSPKHLAIRGVSNGGLLIGAVINQEPEICKVALPSVGIMDMLRYQNFTIGWVWEDEFGSSEDSSHFFNLYSYSPLHNINKKNDYPAVLVTTADHDDRVVPAHSFKYIATLQQKYKGPNPVLIRIQTNTGHGSGKPINIYIEELTDIFSFTFKNLGVTPVYE